MARYIFIFSFLAILPGGCQNQQAPTVPQEQPPITRPDPGKPTEPDWVPKAVLYECNVRQFSAEGNFAGVKQQVPRLKELGIDILWLMPIFPIGKERRKGELGSPYSVRDYTSINPDFGTLDDLKSLVKLVHEHDMKIILDWVPNHSSWDAVWKEKHPEYYTKYNGDFTVPLNERGEPIDDWSDVCDLDYNNPALRKAMTEAMQYWVRECDIDGYRVDMAGLVPNDFWTALRPALDSLKPVFMLAEWQDEPKHFESCFNANYGWKWKDITKDIWNGRQTPHALDTLLEHLNEYYPEHYYQLYFTQNHDENSWAGSESELYGASADAFNVLAFTWQGLPMIYDGQEENTTFRLDFFKRMPIRWKKYSREDFFSKLCALKHINRAVWAGKSGGDVVKIANTAEDKIYSFGREKEGDRVVVILNLSKDRTTVTLTPGDKFAGAYANVFARSTLQVTKEMTLTLKPWEYIVFSSK